MNQDNELENSAKPNLSSGLIASRVEEGVLTIMPAVTKTLKLVAEQGKGLNPDDPIVFEAEVEELPQPTIICMNRKNKNRK